jgi:hypothetical protein
MTSRRWLLSVCACAGVAAVARIVATPRDNLGAWVRVASDSTYAIAVDTTRITRQNGGRLYVVWSRTDHAVTRFDHGRRFNREVVQSLLQCQGFAFRVASVDMSLDGRLVARQRTSAGELGRQAWRRVEAGTTEAIAAQATCDLARRLAK